MKDKTLHPHTLLSWARANNSIVTYALLNSHLPDNSDSEEEIDSIIEFYYPTMFRFLIQCPPTSNKKKS